MRSVLILTLGVVVGISGLVCTGLKAQEARAHLQGVVTDSSGGAVPGATATLANINTGVKMTAHTNEAGLYRFDQIDPGFYTVTIEGTGFSRFSQANFEIRALGDITINATLSPGAVQENVTVEGLAVEIPFNTTDDALTLDSKITQELPQYNRNPFKLTLLQPSAVDTRPGEQSPYNTYSANSVELGGGTNLKNDLEVDGSTVSIGYKVAWVPNADAVQEAIVEKNAVDASVGHSAGGTLSMATKSGTNEIHGSAFWLQRNPKLNAVEDRTTGLVNATRNNIFGISGGNPIIKNKLFNFASFEEQRPRAPGNTLMTVPTALEKTGNFSKSLNADGSLKVIYDPYTTVFNAAAGTATRQPFAGNVIPASRFDSLGALWMSDLYAPNRAPDNLANLNNFAASNTDVTTYWDFSDRVDYYLSSKWRFFARPSWYRTTELYPSPVLQQSPIYVEGGSKRDGFSDANELIYTFSANTMIDLHGDFRDFVDEYYSPAFSGPDPYQKYWPGNNWHAPFAYPPSVYPSMLPGINVGNIALGAGGGNLWQQQPSGSGVSGKLSHTRGKHYLKFGFEERREGGRLLANANNQFTFDAALTANTFLNPNTALSGSPFATMLLGAINDESSAVISPIDHDRIIYYGAYVHDDFKVTRKITLNVGLRYEYETPWYDPLHQQSRGPDFSAPTPFVSANPPQIPASVTSMLNVPYSWTGSWVFTSSSKPGIWNSQSLVFMPRVGVAMRVDDLTSIRFGYARYVVPSELNYEGPPYGSFEAVNFMQPLYAGYDASQAPLPLANGIPQAVVSNPFPSANPLVAPGGTAQGATTGLGVPNIGWGGTDYTRPVNDRVNLSITRQLPSHIIMDATGFANFGHNLNYSYNANQVDPRIIYQYKGATSVTVPNPFYGYLTPQQFPGPLRNLQTVPITDLLVQRPQYGGLWEAFKPGAKERYYSMDLRVQRPFSHGFNFMGAYSYIREKVQVLGPGSGQQSFLVFGSNGYWPDPLDAYLGRLTYLDSPNPHHRGTFSGTYQLPFGKGRTFFSGASRPVDTVIGGWQVIGAWFFQTGDYLQFGPANVTCADPSVSNPTPQEWFNTSCFSPITPYTPRVNPNHYPNIRGPFIWTSQASLSKQVPITPERIKLELKASAYNLTNRFNRGDPDTTITDSGFGTALHQSFPWGGGNMSNSTGREIEFGARLLF